MLQIQENVSLKNFNTFGIDAYARYFVEIAHENELVELFADPQWLQIDRLVLRLMNGFRNCRLGLVIRLLYDNLSV